MLPARARPFPSLLALASLALCACAREATNAAKAAPSAPREVTLALAGTTPLVDSVTAHGTLAADDEVDLAFERSGVIATLSVDIGSQVDAGAVLAKLDVADAELEVRVAQGAVRQARVRLGLAPDGDNDAVDPEATPALRQAQATLTEAKLALARAEELARQELAAGASVEAARASHDVAASRVAQAYNDVRDQQVSLSQRRAELDLALRQIGQSTLTAPFSGVVAARLLSAREYARAGDPVLSILRTHPLRLRLRIPERDAAAIAMDQTVRFVAEGVPGEHVGRVKRLSPRIDTDTRTLLIEAEVDNQQALLRPGLFARARVELAAPQPKVTVPRTAIVSFAGVDKVFVVVDDKAQERLVKVGRRLEGAVEVTEGLAAGESYVAVPGDLVAGQAVKVAGK